MQAGHLYRRVRNAFRSTGIPTADIDAKLLVSAGLGMSVSELMLDEHVNVADGAATTIEKNVQLRLSGMPVGRILGERDFYGRRFCLNAATLEPRPDTETLIDAVLARVETDRPLTLCDVGTGSGAIAVTLLAEMQMSHLIAVDMSEEALTCAARNARLHGVDDRFSPVCADYLSALKTSLAHRLDWIVSNPPYIRTSVLADLEPEVIAHDPLLALDGGESGLDAYVRIVTDSAHILPQAGQIALEIGHDQAEDVKKQLRHHNFGAIEIIKDLGGNDRVAVARKL